MTVTIKNAEQKENRRIEKLAGAVSELRSSEGFQRWLKTRRSFHKYSFRNTILIAVQCPTATYVAGFKKWLKLGRCVRKGEKGIMILAPCTPSAEAVEAAKAEGRDLRVFFRDAFVFDIEQTDPLPDTVQLEFNKAKREPISGNSHEPFIADLTQQVEKMGLVLEWTTGEGEGSYSKREQKIRCSSDLSPNEKCRVLCHELAHAHGVGYDLGRGTAEAIADAAAWLACDAIGLDVSGDSVPYIAEWAEADDDVILRHGKWIDDIARAIAGNYSEEES